MYTVLRSTVLEYVPGYCTVLIKSSARAGRTARDPVVCRQRLGWNPVEYVKLTAKYRAPL
eukprot:COSAG02_NODE_6128_length_3782_cov_4.183458_3_plen_60_part_00